MGQKIRTEIFRFSRWFEVSLTPSLNAANQVIGVVGTHIDITNLKAAKKDLENLNQELERQIQERTADYQVQSAIIQNMSGAVILTKVSDQSIIYFNPRLESMFGYEPGEFKGLKLAALMRQIFSDESLKTTTEYRAQALELGKVTFEVSCSRKDGAPFWARVSSVTFDHPKHGMVLLSAVEDIDEIRKVSHSLEVAEIKYKALIEAAPDSVLVADAQGKIVVANRRLEIIFGYEKDALLGKQVELLLPERVKGSHLSRRIFYFANPLSPPMSTGIELYGRRKDGTEFPIEITLSSFQTPNGVRIATIIRDISQTKKMAAKLKDHLLQEKEARLAAEQANESKNVFLSTLSHELRTPLTSILSWSQLLRRVQMSPEKVVHGLNIIEQSVNSQVQMINDLLDISRIQSGKLALTLTENTLNEVIQGAVDSVRLFAEKKNINIQWADHSQSAKVCGDRVRLQQIISNLLTNSIKFSPCESQVDVSIYRVQENDQSFVVIRIADQGQGIEPSFLPYLFTRFSQQDSTSTRIHGGLGIGLALVHDLVKSHAGKVKAESDGPGLGATFTVQLPLMPDQDEKSVIALKRVELQAQTDVPSLTDLRVLVVDDEPSSLEALCEAVKALGGDPHPCKSVRDALLAFEDYRPHVIVSDLAMPQEDGYSLIRRVRSLPPERGGRVPALAVTAFASSHYSKNALKDGFQEYLSKPIDTDVLGRAIVRLVKRPDELLG